MSDASTIETPAKPQGDYSPKVPRQVRRAAERAQELLDEQQAAQTEAEVAEAEAEAVVSPASAEPGPAPEVSTPPAQEDETWQHRYQSLQGKYNAEIPGLRQQVQHLEHLIATMHTAPAMPQPQAPEPPVIDNDIPEEDYAAYGTDFVDSSRRWARVEADSRVQPLEQQMAELRANQQRIEQERRESRVKSELSADPDLSGRWNQVDNDPNFHYWLSLVDPLTGVRRHDILHQAFASGDAVRTGAFFKAYLNEQTVSRTDAYTPAPQTMTNGHAGQVDLAQYAAPGRAPNATPGVGAQQQVRIWSNRDIAAFYQDRLRGRYRGREAEATALERDIHAASQEGRVRNT